MRPRTAVRITVPMLAAIIAGGSPVAPANPLDSAWQWRAQGAGVHRFDTDLDDGGSVSTDRYFLSLGTSTRVGSGWAVGVEAGYGADRYDFSGSDGFGDLDPWGTVQEFRISAPVRYLASPDWSFFAIPSVRFHAEDGASLGDGRTEGLLAGASYRVSDRLSIGPGFGAFSDLEDDGSLFPILVVDWQITDRVSLETGGGFAASRGPGLQLNWRHSEQWRFSVGGRYEESRFRLDDGGPAPGGIGETKSIPLYLQARYSLSPAASIGFVGGAEVGGELRVGDSDGNWLQSTDVDPVPFLGITFRADL